MAVARRAAVAPVLRRGLATSVVRRKFFFLPSGRRRREKGEEEGRRKEIGNLNFGGISFSRGGFGEGGGQLSLLGVAEDWNWFD